MPKKSAQLLPTSKAMDSTATRKMTIARNNKENKKPTSESSKLQATQDAQRMKGGLNRALTSKNSTKGEVFPRDKVPVKKDTLDKKKRKVGPAGPPTDIKHQTLSQTFLSQQAMQQKKLVAQITKSHATMPPKATYKGCVVPSKVNSFRKPVGDNKEATAKPVEKPLVSMEAKLKNVMERPKCTAVPRLGLPKSSALPPRPTAVSQKPAQPMVRPATTSGAQQLPCSLKPPAARSAPGILSHPGSSKFPTTLNRKGVLSNGNAQVPAAVNEKTKKPPVGSTVSQYRVSMETAKERRAKLAEWLASKGRTLKRPPIASTLSKPSRPVTKAQSNHQLSTKPMSGVESMSAREIHLNLEPQVEPQHEPEEHSTSSTDIMNTTLDLLDNSDMELPVDPQVRKDDLVVDLCSALEALEVPSAEINHREIEEDVRKEECKVEMKEARVLEAEENEHVEVGEEEDVSEREVKQENSREGGRSDEGVEEAEMEAASTVRYSVRTTPYLQNMKQRIQGEVTPARSTSRHRSSTIKDLKFLTPVRRSCRIQRQSAQLPGMLTDHDPSVSSLAELAKLDDDSNAYIFRHNPALLETLPDQPGEA